MKKAIQLALLLLLMVSTTGCTGGYWLDRGRDATDIVTLTIGTGAGAKARAGPLHAGLFMNYVDFVGLRGGNCRVFHAPWERGCPGGTESSEYDLTVVYMEIFEADALDRNKDYRAGNVTSLPIPFLGFVWEGTEPGSGIKPVFHPYYTQFEVAGGFLATVRLGLNPGEMLDFLLGWTTLDIFGDDVKARTRKEEKSNQRIETDG
jgi:hypothetical protein